MTLDNFINELKQALNIQSLQAQKQGFSLLFDDSLAVVILTTRGELVFLSPAPALAENSYQQEQQIKQAMAWSLPWKGGNTSLTLSNGGGLMVQTRLAINEQFQVLREALNNHCQFVEQLEQLELKAVQQVYQDVFIRP